MSSKASFLDGDDIPAYNLDNSQKYKFSGRRVKHGLYRSCDGHLISSDANGAANIGRKCSLDGFNLERVVAVLAQPKRRENLLRNPPIHR